MLNSPYASPRSLLTFTRIHMLPLGPHSAFTRRTNFVLEEWNSYFSNGRVDKVQGGWRGILYANYALINPSAAWAFFTQRNFDQSWLDGGASLTWYLAWCAALGGA
jgi:endo-1,3(4)-beta-glucanase